MRNIQPTFELASKHKNERNLAPQMLLENVGNPEPRMLERCRKVLSTPSTTMCSADRELDLLLIGSLSINTDGPFAQLEHYTIRLRC